MVLFLKQDANRRTWPRIVRMFGCAREVTINIITLASAGISSLSEGNFPERAARETAVAEDDSFFSSMKPTTTGTPSVNDKKAKSSAAVATAPWMETVKSLVPASFSGKVN